MLAAWDLAGRRPRGADDATISGRWCELVDAVAFQEGQDVLLSDEYLATRTRRQARRAINDLSARHEVHVVVTVRDLGRVLTSSWPEDVKSGSTATWPEYVAAVRVPERSPGTRPAASGCGRTSRTCSRCGPWRRAPTASTSSPSRHRARGPPSCSSASDRSWGTTPPR